ncbi:MAG: c-type cytochrome, partial [Flavisolibacter sp.]|nr:c-type cytochrome [Flavisolibacter sp.]
NKRKVLILMSSFAVAGCSFYFNTTKDQFTARSNKGSFERGKNLAFNICAGCHYDPKVGKFIGRDLNDLPKIAGHLYSANLTQSKTNGIPPFYSDAELFYLLKTGISKSGKFTPYMMRPMMADEDINDIIVYLRSNDEAVAPADTTIGKTHINFIGKAGIRLASKPQSYNKGVQRPDENNSVEYGRYLVAVIGCYHCHSSKVLGLNYSDPEKSKGYLQGGIKLKDPEGKRLYGPNLTPDEETGIGNFSEQDFKKAIQEGITPSGRTLSPPMGKFKSLTDKQVHSIYTYLRSLKPVHHEIERRS